MLKVILIMWGISLLLEATVSAITIGAASDITWILGKFTAAGLVLWLGIRIGRKKHKEGEV